MKTAYLALWTLVLMLTVKLGCSLTCLQCDAVTHPRHCRHVVHCSAGEVCVLHAVTTHFGEHLYNTGCSHASICSYTTSTTGSCVHCCSSDLCNAQGCGAIGYPSDRGPICYHCPTPTDFGTCHMIEFCEPEEVCYYSVREEFGELEYTGDCTSKHLCSISGIFGNIIVGRGLEQNEDAVPRSLRKEMCEGCCEHDLCNNGCNTTYRLCDRKTASVTGKCVGNGNNFTCICDPGISGRRCEIVPGNCFDIQQSGLGSEDGVYHVQLWRSRRNITVYCDMTTEGGGWTVFQKRFNGSVDFFRNFKNYTYGFGDLLGEFWLGLDNIHQMTTQKPMELRIDLTAPNGTRGHEFFRNFYISEGPGFNLHNDLGTGTLGDSSSDGLSSTVGMAFTTFDHDNDTSWENCAERWHGAWWYGSCMTVNLNGQYLSPGNYSSFSMYYHAFTKGENSLLSSQMMFRPQV